MMTGYAFHVQFPRRKEQNYVCTDPAYVAKDLMQSVIECGWKCWVSLIPYRGETALSVTYNVADLFEIEPNLERWFDRIAGELISCPHNTK